MDKPRIAFIGLGVMGLPMAGHLARTGYALTAYDISNEPMQRLKALKRVQSLPSLSSWLAAMQPAWRA